MPHILYIMELRLMIDSTLVKRCKVQNVVFDAGFSVNVIRLKVPVPKSPGSEEPGGPRHVTRMKDTDFFQALSMYFSFENNLSRFECAFPFASDKEKEAERQYIEKQFSFVNHEQVKGIWVTSETAQQLAKDYHLEDYVSALIDAAPGKPKDGLTPVPQSKGATEQAAVKEESEPASAPGPKRSRRSASPRKATTRQPKAPSSTTSGRGRRKKGSVADDESVASTSSPVIPDATIIKAEEALDKVIEEGPPILDSIKVKVSSPVVIDGRKMMRRHYLRRRRRKWKRQRQRKSLRRRRPV
jgi:hypothetical protein